MRPLRVLALVALAAALAAACTTASADVYEYDVTISVPNGSANWDSGSEAGSQSSSWSATWPDVNFHTTPAQQIARIEPASFSRHLAPLPLATPVNNGIAGSWHSTYQTGQGWSCAIPPGFDFSAFGPLQLVLTGGGVDESVRSTSTSYAQSGRIGMSLANVNSNQPAVAAACSGNIDADLYEQIHPYSWIGLYTCFGDRDISGQTLSFPVDQLGQSQISFQATVSQGSSLPPPAFVCYDRAYGNSWGVSGTYNVTMTRVGQPLQSYGGNLGVSQGTLDELERFESDRNDRFQRNLLKIWGLLERDAQRHPGKRARADLKTLKVVKTEFKRFSKDYRRTLDQGNFQHSPIKVDPEEIVTQSDVRARASIDDNERKTLNQAMEYGITEGAKSLKEYLKEQKVADGKAADLVQHLTDLDGLLNGRIDPAGKEGDKLMKSSLIGLVSTFGKLDKNSKLPKAAEKIYDLLRTDKNKLADYVDSQVQTEVQNYAEKLAGKDGKELAKQIFTLRDVLSGKFEDDKEKQYTVLKDSLASLASRLYGEDVLKLPQIRAAMFGFKLGKAFGDRIAADLKIVVSTSLVRECKEVIAKAQGTTPGEIDYSKDTQRFIDLPASTFKDWICKLHPESVVDGLDGGVIEAISPVNTLFGRKIPLSDRLGVHLTGGQSVFFDTHYSNAG